MPIRTRPARGVDLSTLLHAPRWLVTICAAGFLMSAGMGLVNPVLPLFAHAFGPSTSLVGLVVTVFALGRVLVSIPSGQLADRWGYRALIVYGSIVFVVATAGVAWASSYPSLLAFRLLQGVGSAMQMSGCLLAVTNLSPLDERGRAASLFQVSILLGLIVGPVVGGSLADPLGIRAPFVGNIMLGILVGVVAWRHLPKALGQSQVPLAAPMLKGTARRFRLPIRDLLADHNFLLVSIAAGAIFFTRSGARDTLLPLFGHDELGLSTATLGLVFSLMALCELLCVPVSGLLSDKFGRKQAIVPGLGCIGLALGLTGASSSYLWFLVVGLLLGVGKGLSESVTVVYVSDIAPEGKSGLTFGLFMTLRDIGLLAGPIAVGWAADTVGFRLPFILNAVALVGTTLLFALFAAETRKVGARADTVPTRR